MKKSTFLKVSTVATLTLSLLPGIGTSVSNSPIANSSVHAETVQPTASAIGVPKPPINVISMVNGGFEQPAFSGSYSMFDASQVPGWNTTAQDNNIEIQRTIVSPFEGSQYAELNAYYVGALYQDIATTPGSKIRWQAAHRGRDGTDVANVQFGTPGNLSTVATLSTGKSWKTYSGSYTIPAGQTTTRFQFNSVSSASGTPSSGNLLDDVIFSTQSFITVASDGPAVIKLGKSDTYTFTAKNEGGMASQNTTLSIPLPQELYYAAGSVKVDGVAATGNYNSSTKTLEVPLGSIEKDASKVVTFDTTGIMKSTDRQVQATVTHQDKGFTDETYTNYSDVVATDVVANNKPTLFAENHSIRVNEVFDPRADISATDVEDGDLTASIVIESYDVNIAQPGMYHVTYSITDSDGNRTEKTISVSVGSKTPPVITGDTTTKLNPNATFDPMSSMQATDEEDGDLTDKLKVTSNDVDTSTPGTYHVEYSVTDSDDMTTTFTRTVIVTEAPVLTGDRATTINIHDTFDPMSTMQATDKEDGDITDQIQVDGAVDTETAGDYTLTYTVTDSDGNKDTLTRIVTVYDNTIFGFSEQPEDLLFQTTEIGSNDVTIPRVDPNWKIKIEDTRHNGNHWALTGTVNGPFVDTDDTTAKQLHNALTYTENGEKTRLQDNQTFQIGTGVSDDDTITTIQSPADEGIQMDINPTGVKAGDNYQTSITWTLRDAPDL
ncbi:immunoglobulin-like domain-containing protein [Listeria booriae]|uniref:immunoglobulin-like domain-containing protein n=1 Tax=Listeria booriae TaxID=1552123 RepID=UPI0016282082|nr:immunoglobulin-like domain-containing protein [Listeria booriae]MBC1800082.1 DUF5011 domain-containing protein [Listeria booriae]MBC1813586.1 DUF5011 domain-containing protein [Listeria booriae]